MISFLLNDTPVKITGGDSNQTVLEWLRKNQQLTGTKEGCGSGDCGACTVVLVEPDSSGTSLSYKSINSCITVLSALDGKQLITVEHLSSSEGLHPVQQALVDSNGSQCGFCTPGFVMSMFSLTKSNTGNISRQEVDNALSGNLCRCTGYKPIIEACMTVIDNRKSDKFDLAAQETLKQLHAMPDESPGIEGLYLPNSRKELKQLISRYPDAKLVAGSTDLALEITQQYKSIPHLIAITKVPELLRLEETDHSITIGAAVTYENLTPLLISQFPECEELLNRLGSLPIRNQGTMGGNIANASPIGDSPPLLLALNATLILDNGCETREVPVNEFFKGYRNTVLKNEEWIDAIVIPKRVPGTHLRIYKISKRLEDDISAVCAAFSVTLENDVITSASFGFGGVSAIPESLSSLQNAVIGKSFDKSLIKSGKRILAQAFSPIDDVRASAQYRRDMSASLWERFILERLYSQNDRIKVRIEDYA